MSRPPLPVLLLAPLAYLFICALIAGLAAYPLHLVLPEGLVGFHTLVSRGAEVLLAFGLVPFGRRIGVGRPQMGMALSNTLFWRLFLRGLGYGILMLGLHTLFLIAFDVRDIIYDRLEIIRIIRLAGKGLLIGLAVSSIEEPVFRGFLLGSLADRTSRFNAAWISASYFAALHFLDSDLRPSSGEIHWNSGVLIVLDAFEQWRKIELNSFLALFTAGLFLACVRLRHPDDGLGLCIGIHAGWVFIIKTAKPFTYVNPLSSWNYLVSHFDGFIGYLSSAWISLLILALTWAIMKNPRTEPQVQTK